MKISINMKNAIIRIGQCIPRSIRSIMWKTYWFPEDFVNSLLGRKDELIPPKGLVFIGCGDFKKTGEEFFHYFIEFGELKPNEKVLDVGCGNGRMAVPLIGYIKGEGLYEGFDIVVEGINWCKKSITSKYPHFHFQVADLYNKEYNPKGKYKASEYKFLYENDSFDFVFLTSVFTHMLPQDMENYFSEIARILKRNGRCLMTFFLLNEESVNFRTFFASESLRA